MEHPIIIKACIDIISAFILSYILYYRRYRNKSLFAGAMMINVFVFCVMIIITDGNIALQAGLGLFGILSILRFRSENFEKMEMVYFFGSIAIAAVNGVASVGVDLYAANLLIIAVAWIFDGDLLGPRVQSMHVQLDYIPKNLFNEEATKNELSQKLGVVVNAYTVRMADYVKETVEFNLDYIVR
jgi:hypothetical protein